jgi:outer membrane immunogenic protein
VSAPAFSWAGWYVGVSVGYAMHHSSQTDVGCYFPCSTWDGWSDGVAVGGHIGYNWQFGNFVYGLEADAS